MNEAGRGPNGIDLRLPIKSAQLSFSATLPCRQDERDHRCEQMKP